MATLLEQAQTTMHAVLTFSVKRNNYYSDIQNLFR
jgi:hypothetical protein